MSEISKRITLRGVHHLSLDAKGRMAVPARYRALLSEWCDSQLVVTIDTQDKCLLMYPLPEWEKIEEKLMALANYQGPNRRIQRLLLGYATDLEIDTNGRILLPGTLRDYAVLDKKMVMLGQGNKFELWDEATWDARRQEYLCQEDEDLPAELLNISL